MQEVAATDNGSRREEGMAQLAALVTMRDLKQMKKADERLIVAIIICISMGLLQLAVCLHAYFKHALQLDADRPLPVSVSQPLIKYAQIFTYWFLPVIAAGCFWVAYYIWAYRRKRGKIKEHGNTHT